MKCSTSRCSNDGVVQWQKRLSRDGLDSHLAEIHAQLVAQAEEQRLSLRVQIAALKGSGAPSGLSSTDEQAFLQRVAEQLEDLQAQHDEIPTEFDMSHHEVGSTQAQFACAKHRRDDDWLALVHEADCSGASDCGCP